MPGPRIGSGIGGGVGTAIGGPIGAAVGGQVGGWVSNLFGGTHQATVEHVQQLFGEHPEVEWDKNFLGPMLSRIRDFSQNLDPYDPNYARWFMNNIVAPMYAELMAANDLGTVAALQASIDYHGRQITHHQGLARTTRNSSHIDETIALSEHLTQVATEAITFINSGSGGGTATGGEPIGTGGGSTGGFIGGGVTTGGVGGGGSFTLPVIGEVSKLAAIGAAVVFAGLAFVVIRK